MRALALCALASLAMVQYSVASHDRAAVLSFHCDDPATCVDGYQGSGPSFVEVRHHRWLHDVFLGGLS